MARDSLLNTITVALVLCIVCSVMVSSAAVLLRPLQEANKKFDQQRNVLSAAGLDVAAMTATDIEALFHDESQIRRVLIDLDTGQPVDLKATEIDPASYDAKQAAKSPELSQPVQAAGGPTLGTPRREKYAFVYEMLTDGQIDLYVLPIYGKGLWSTLYGFLALDGDTRTVRGITFYEHRETPGLGGEVDNPAWKATWIGKQVSDQDGQVDFSIIKGRVDPQSQQAAHQVDGLSGATITSRGVSDAVQYWLGADGFGKYLQQQQSP